MIIKYSIWAGLALLTLGAWALHPILGIVLFVVLGFYTIVFDLFPQKIL